MTKNNIPITNIDIKKPVEEVRYYDNWQGEELITNQDGKLVLSTETKTKLLDPQSRFNPSPTIFPVFVEQWEDLRIPCPVNDSSHCSNNTVSDWYHANNNNFLATTNYSSCGKLEISNQVYIRCKGCRSAGKIKEWMFKCHLHQHYMSSNQASFISSLIAALMDRSFSEDFTSNLIHALS